MSLLPTRSRQRLIVSWIFPSKTQLGTRRGRNEEGRRYLICRVHRSCFSKWENLYKRLGGGAGPSASKPRDRGQSLETKAVALIAPAFGLSCSFLSENAAVGPMWLFFFLPCAIYSNEQMPQQYFSKEAELLTIYSWSCRSCFELRLELSVAVGKVM